VAAGDARLIVINSLGGSDMKAFVTGGTGLLGMNLIRQLVSDGHEVRALVRSMDKARRQFASLWEPWRSRLTFVEGDLADVASFGPALTGCDLVFHTAAYFREYYQPGDHWATLEALNVHATQRLLEAAEQHGVRRLVHVSTVGVIGMTPDERPGDESTPPTSRQMRNLYFRSKHLADWMIDTFERASRLEVVTVHPGWMFGPGDAAPTSAGALVLQFLRRELPGMPDGGINVVDARDVAAGMLTAAERELAVTFRPLDETLRDVIRWFASQGVVPASVAGSATDDPAPGAVIGQHALSGS
jgi:dihydroflavonol-4-reductase